MSKKRIFIVGATGQIGTPLTKNLLKLGHDIKAVVRKRDATKEAKLAKFEELGAEIFICEDTTNVELMSEAMKGFDTVIVCTAANEFTLTKLEPAVLEAALKAGVKRFVPNEFGVHTRGIEMGDGVLFDKKKAFHEKIFKSGIAWTFFYNGLIFDYCLPNLRFFETVTTFGKMDIKLYTHVIKDIGRVAALALTDERTLNKCVQMDYNGLTQTDMLNMLKKSWPDYKFEFTHYSTEFITKMKDEASDEVTAKKGTETDQERWGINYVLYVIGKLASFTDETLRASELYPDVVCKKPEEALADKGFVFE